MTRRALLLAGLVLLLFVPSAASGGPVGVLRHRPDSDARQPGHRRDGSRPRADEPLPAQVGLGAADQRLLVSMGPAGRVRRPAGHPGNPGGPGRVGEPGLAGGLGLDSPDRWAGCRECVAEPPQGAGGALRPGRRLLDHRATASDTDRTPTRTRSCPGRSGTSPTCRSTSRPPPRPASTPGSCRSQTMRSRASMPEPRSCSPDYRATGRSAPGTSSTPSTGLPGSRTSSTPPPSIRTRPPSPASAR